MIVLGSTGSIGTNTLNIAHEFNLKVEALSTNSNVALLNEQIKIFKPRFVAVGDEKLKHKIAHDNIFCGNNEICEMISQCESDLVVNALVGFAGLSASVKTQQLKKTLALANKESLVIAGQFLDMKKIIPIDSEHFGLKYLLGDKKPKKLIITASGGAFRDTPLQKIPTLKSADALKHPNWSMGKKITIDSATMVNKLFELIEAKWLFNCENLDAFIEQKSLIHALVEFHDGSTTAHFANADMKLPIAYAVLKKVNKPILPHVNLLTMGQIEFKKIEQNRYPIWEIKDFILNNPHLGVVLNAANEIGVKEFLKDKINIIKLIQIIKQALKKFEDIKANDLNDIFKIDSEVRTFCTNLT